MTVPNAAASARNHHWISQLYLAKFTEAGHKKSKLCVFDLQEQRTYRTRPRNVCAQRDFNRIICDVHRPDIVETSLGSFESEVESALTKIIEKPDAFFGEALRHTMLKFVSLLAARSPHTRNRMGRYVGDRLLEEYSRATDTPDKFAAAAASAQAPGGLPQSSVDFERHRAFLSDRRFRLFFHRNFLITGELHAADRVYRRLAQRRWVLLKASADSGGFITTDSPVALCPSDPGSTPPGQLLGFASRNTMVLFPFCPTLLAVGTCQGRQGVAAGAGRELVGRLNQLLLTRCQKLIFAPHERFEVSLGSGQYAIGARVLGMFTRRDRSEGTVMP